MLIQEQTVVQARRGQPTLQSVTQPVWHRETDWEFLARVKEFDGDGDKLLAECPADIERDQLGEFDQEIKECAAESRRVLRRDSLRERLRVRLRVCPHVERECCAIALRDQLTVVKRDCKRMRVQIAHTSVALNKANAMRGKPRTVPMDF